MIKESSALYFREQYTSMINEKQEAIVRVRRDMKDVFLNGQAERVWVSLFRQYGNIEALDRRVLMALVDKIFIYEKHGVEVCFRYGDEYKRMMEYARGSADCLPHAAGEV